MVSQLSACYNLHMENIKIRKAKIADIEQIFRLSNAVARVAYAHIIPKEFFDEREQFTRTNRKEKAQGMNKNGCIDYVAEADSKIVGTFHATTSGYGPFEKPGYSAIIALYIHPDYQRIGLGKKLFDVAVSELVKFGATQMVIGVLKENLQARKAYEKWGGKLDTYEALYKEKYPEVFYTYDLEKVGLKSVMVGENL